MIYLIFNCVSANRDVTINEEFDDYAWSKPKISKTTIQCRHPRYSQPERATLVQHTAFNPPGVMPRIMRVATIRSHASAA